MYQTLGQIPSSSRKRTASLSRKNFESLTVALPLVATSALRSPIQRAPIVQASTQAGSLPTSVLWTQRMHLPTVPFLAGTGYSGIGWPFRFGGAGGGSSQLK